MKELTIFSHETLIKIRRDNSITAGSRLLFEEIVLLCAQYNQCDKTNSYFAELFEVSNVTVSKWISELLKRGYISSDIIYKEGTKEIDRRIIKALVTERYNLEL